MYSVEMKRSSWRHNASPALGPAQKPTRRIMLLKGLHYIGLEVHKKTIS